MGGEQKLTGPDLANGVPLAGLEDGKLVVGHANGEAIVLARQGQQVFAVGATCTHYSGPLGEGLLVDGTIRCPWHHACFDLRTGEPLRAPALNPIPRFDVSVEAGVVRVGKRKSEAKPPAGTGASPPRIVIIGAGAAGNAAAETLRREGYRGELVMIGGDPALPVDRPNLSKDYLAGNAPEEWLPLRSSEFYAEHRIALKLGVHVASIDIARQARRAR